MQKDYNKYSFLEASWIKMGEVHMCSLIWIFPGHRCPKVGFLLQHAYMPHVDCRGSDPHSELSLCRTHKPEITLSLNESQINLEDWSSLTADQSMCVKLQSNISCWDGIVFALYHMYVHIVNIQNNMDMRMIYLHHNVIKHEKATGRSTWKTH